MTRDPRDPAFDDRVYCSRCLHLLSEDDIPRDDEDAAVMGCPYCHVPLMSGLRHDQMHTERAIRRADWDAAREDGLIR